eukprot:COSAG01_NODE_39091_length_481_cov_0.845550_1_plen_30_part_01
MIFFHVTSFCHAPCLFGGILLLCWKDVSAS